MKKLILLSTLIILFSIGIVNAVTTYLDNPAAIGSGGVIDTVHANTGDASWKNNDIKFETYLIYSTTSQFGKTITIDDIESIEYHTYKDSAQSGINFYINIYTEPYTGGSSSWYGDRLTFEPMYSYGFVDTVGSWNKWSTDSGTNQLTIYDQPKSGFYGWYYPPTLSDLQAGPIDWNSYFGLSPVTNIDYGSHVIKYLVVDTGSATTVGFEGSVDSITINLKDASSYTFDLEAPCADGDESERCCIAASGDWQSDLPSGYQCCGDDGNADFGNIVYNGIDEDFLCNYDSTWYGGMSYPGEIEYISEQKYDDLSNGAAWLYCDANADGEDHGPNGVMLTDMQEVTVSGHEYVCLDYLNDYESIAECCGDEACNTGTDDGLRKIAGETVTSSDQETRCCTSEETWEETEVCDDGYDNDCDGLVDMDDTADCECLVDDDCNQYDDACSDGACMANKCEQVMKPVDTVCRESAGACDIAEVCDGLTAACPQDAKSIDECRASVGTCDVAESCDGLNNDCPADVLQPAQTVCRESAGVCDIAEVCDGLTADCPADEKSAAATVCRPSAGDCDVEEVCDGVSDNCPTDSFKASTVRCRKADGACDKAEFCTGSDALCPEDKVRPTTRICRQSAGDCDLIEYCDGVTKLCPTNTFKADTEVCRPSEGVCDIEEACTGSSALCPEDSKSTSVCRPGTECDTEESCDGESNDCPVDEKEPQGTLCGTARDCLDDVCNGFVAEFYPDDGHDICDGQGSCSVYSCVIEDSYCSDDDTGDGINDLSCGAACDQDTDCEPTLCADECVDGKFKECADPVNTCTGGCSCTVNDCSEIEECTNAGNDVDQDGFDAECGDCDDNNSAVYPGASEICDSLDNNCNGKVDEGLGADQCIGTCEIFRGFTWAGNGGQLNCCGDDALEASPYEATELSCQDGNDNDCDGLSDLDDSNCQCDYSEWQSGACVSDGEREETRTETTGFAWCTDPLTQNVLDEACACVPTVDSVCIADGQAEVTTGWNYPYCGQSVVTQETDTACNCFSDWQKFSCTGDHDNALFTRTKLRQDTWCQGPTVKSEHDTACGLIDSDKDGVINNNDNCPSTPLRTAVDTTGCSADQFCRQYNTKLPPGQLQCWMGDWKNNEAALFPNDCTVKRSGNGKSATTWCGAASRPN
ncbi:MAG: MopE-related protein [archaeon]